ncbi:MAG: M23 family metallopeptidase [Oscillospiraceae bacterium]|nr:M23 family metallopeptidase [Oscillospiraceae bacterium]
MTEHELERMISLADDKYIEEVFEQNIQMKKRFPVAVPFVAAAAIVCGLFFAARPTETKIENMVASEVTGVTTAVEELDEYNENLRYWKYFDGDTSVIEEIQYEKESMVYIFQNAYTHACADLPFEYKANGLQIYCNDEGNPLYMYVTISNGATVEGYPKQFGLWVTNCGTPFIGYPLENSTPENVNGIDVYGFESSDDNLDAYFNIDGIGYTVTFNNMTYKDAYEAIEMLIERKLSISDFDISKGTVLTHYKLNNLSSPYILSLASPVEGEISSPYGNLNSNFHKGIDFKADEGTPVYAAADGVVIVPVDVDTGDGKNVTVSHYANVNTFYAHLSEVIVSEGDEVKQGDIIGYVGSTGSSTGPHLHFELCIDGEYVDPIDYFSDQTKADILLQNELGMHELLESEFSQIHLPNQPTEN